MPKKSVTSIGLDLSLVRSGTVILNSKEVLHHGIIKSKPSGKSFLDELYRIRNIAEEIECLLPDHDIDIAIIENLAFGVRNSVALTQLSGLSFFVKSFLADREIPFVMVAPTSLKKYATGSGKGDKDMLMMAVYKNYGFESFDNNEADAYVLAQIGLSLLGEETRPLTIPQKEVIDLLKTQLQ